VFMFCACGPIFDGVEGVGSSSHVLRSWTIFDDTEGVVPVFLFVPLGPVFHGSVRPFFAPLTALKKELDDELRKKDTEIPLSVHWGIFI
jgi:hypothetical protein